MPFYPERPSTDENAKGEVSKCFCMCCCIAKTSVCDVPRTEECVVVQKAGH